jgi:hypothetical protein
MISGSTSAFIFAQMRAGFAGFGVRDLVVDQLQSCRAQARGDMVMSSLGARRRIAGDVIEQIPRPSRHGSVW